MVSTLSQLVDASSADDDFLIPAIIPLIAIVSVQWSTHSHQILCLKLALYISPTIVGMLLWVLPKPIVYYANDPLAKIPRILKGKPVHMPVHEPTPDYGPMAWKCVYNQDCNLIVRKLESKI